MEEKEFFNFFPFAERVFFKCFMGVFVFWVIAHIISYWYYGEVTRTDLVGSTFAAIIFSYFLHLLIIFKKPE